MQRQEGLLSPQNVERLATVLQVVQIGRSLLSTVSLHPIDAISNLALALYLEKGIVLGLNGAEYLFKGSSFAHEAKRYSSYISENYSSITKLSDIVSAKIGNAISNADTNLKEIIRNNIPGSR